MQKLYINEYLQRQLQTLFHILHEDSLVHSRKEPYKHIYNASQDFSSYYPANVVLELLCHVC